MFLRMNKTLTITLGILIVIGIGVLAILIGSGGDSEQGSQSEETEQSQQRDTEDQSSVGSLNENEDVNSPNESESEDGEAAATVTYQDGSFRPQTVTIQQGQSVRFVNEGDGQMWVGSDQHPTHTQYDGTSVNEHCEGGVSSFDQCTTGQTFTFTFDKSGEWGYHNHVNASAGGTVIVE